MGNSSLTKVKEAFNVYYEFPRGDYSMLSFPNILDTISLLFFLSTQLSGLVLFGSESRKSFTKHKHKLQKRRHFREKKCQTKIPDRLRPHGT